MEYTAGADTGFNVHNPVPDTFAQAQNSPLIFHVSFRNCMVNLEIPTIILAN